MNVKKDIIANTIGMFSNMIALWLMSVFVVWIVGYKGAGDFAIALSAANILSSIASFSMRFYYSADIEHKYSDRQYFIGRFITILLSIGVSALSVVLLKYDRNLALTVLFFYLYKCIEMAADILFGAMQRYGKLVYSGYSMLMKSFGSLVLFVIVLFLTRSLVITFLIMTIYASSIFLLFDYRISVRLSAGVLAKSKDDWKRAMRIICICFPLFVVTLCYNFIPSIPRIVFEQIYSGKELGYYASISTITVLISTAISCIALPIMPKLSYAFKERKRDDLIKTLLIMLFLTLTIGGIGCIATSLFGEMVLVFVFGGDIKPYVYLMYGLIIASTMTALISCFINFFVAAEKLKQLMVISVIGLFVCLFSVVPLCKNYYMLGLVYCLIISQGLEIVLMGISIKKMLEDLLDE